MIEVRREDENSMARECWRKVIVDYLKDSRLLENKNDGRKLRLKALDTL